jgi:hypothetical protein
VQVPKSFDRDPLTATGRSREPVPSVKHAGGSAHDVRSIAFRYPLNRRSCERCRELFAGRGPASPPAQGRRMVGSDAEPSALGACPSVPRNPQVPDSNGLLSFAVGK